MRLNRVSFPQLRKWAGFLIGESVHSVLLAFGLMWAMVLILNGFDGIATVRFVDNTVGRMLSADPARQANFIHFFVVFFLLTLAGVVFVRAIDRMTKGKARV